MLTYIPVSFLFFVLFLGFGLGLKIGLGLGWVLGLGFGFGFRIGNLLPAQWIHALARRLCFDLRKKEKSFCYNKVGLFQYCIMMPIGGKKEGESSGDESKKRATSPATDNNDSDSVDGGRRSRRKKTKVSSVCINALTCFYTNEIRAYTVHKYLPLTFMYI